ncbi:hypothetical protein K9L97_02730 [Candidatus Woesearchaeota archaeon]|nr:hypothetical protein [Candidatus Woesearchaeota archaeon]
MNINDSNLPVVCRSCLRTVTMSQIKFDEVTKQYVCTSCYNATKNKKQHLTNTKNDETHTISASKKINYQCPKCKYKFSRPKEKPAKECPYCGNKILETRNNTASRLIDEAEEW